jgi:HEAT repeat protein
LAQRYAKMRVLAIRYLASKAMEEARMLGKKPERVRVRWPALGALPFLVLMLRDAKDWEDRWAAIKLLGEMKQHASQAIPALLRFLKEGQRVEILTELATTFGRIGASAHVALPTLRSFYTKTPNHPLRSAILYALWKVDPTDQESRILIYQAIQDPHIQVRLLAVVAIADLRPYEDAMTAYLARAYKDPHWLVRLAAIKGCERLGMLASANLPIFRLALRDPHWQVRHLTARALPALGPRAQKARGDLTLLLRDPDARVRKAAKETLASWSVEQ